MQLKLKSLNVLKFQCRNHFEWARKVYHIVIFCYYKGNGGLSYENNPRAFAFRSVSFRVMISIRSAKCIFSIGTFRKTNFCCHQKFPTATNLQNSTATLAKFPRVRCYIANLLPVEISTGNKKFYFRKVSIEKMHFALRIDIITLKLTDLKANARGVIFVRQKKLIPLVPVVAKSNDV